MRRLRLLSSEICAVLLFPINCLLLLILTTSTTTSKVIKRKVKPIFVFVPLSHLSIAPVTLVWNGSFFLLDCVRLDNSSSLSLLCRLHLVDPSSPKQPPLISRHPAAAFIEILSPDLVTFYCHSRIFLSSWVRMLLHFVT